MKKLVLVSLWKKPSLAWLSLTETEHVRKLHVYNLSFFFPFFVNNMKMNVQNNTDRTVGRVCLRGYLGHKAAAVYGTEPSGPHELSTRNTVSLIKQSPLSCWLCGNGDGVLGYSAAAPLCCVAWRQMLGAWLRFGSYSRCCTSYLRHWDGSAS